MPLRAFPEALGFGEKTVRESGRKGRKCELTIFGRSLSSFACSYSVSMLSAERKKSVGCKMSKRDESDMARTANRCVLHRILSGRSGSLARCVRTSFSSLYC